MLAAALSGYMSGEADEAKFRAVVMQCIYSAREEEEERRTEWRKIVEKGKT